LGDADVAILTTILVFTYVRAGVGASSNPENRRVEGSLGLPQGAFLTCTLRCVKRSRLCLRPFTLNQLS
jgi:hypothetical protein